VEATALRTPDELHRARVPDAALGGRYRVGAVDHDIYMVRLASLRWQVLDVAPTDVVIVDTLTGFDDRFEQARALADDYAAEKQAFYGGRREDDPMPDVRKESGRRDGARRRSRDTGRWP
jgi:hypothetical protein